MILDIQKIGGSNQTYTKLLDHLPTETEMNQMHNDVRKAISEKLKLEKRLNYFKADTKSYIFSIIYIQAPCR
jgi:Tfp pilus assembly protein PilO